MAKLIINIEPGGATEIKVEGHAGPGCQNLTKQIEAALGVVKEDRKLPEYHSAAKQSNNATASN